MQDYLFQNAGREFWMARANCFSHPRIGCTLDRDLRQDGGRGGISSSSQSQRGLESNPRVGIRRSSHHGREQLRVLIQAWLGQPNRQFTNSGVSIVASSNEYFGVELPQAR